MSARPSAAAYGPIPRSAFDIVARRVITKLTDRDRAYQWICAEQEQGKVWWSVHHAVHAWVTAQVAGQSGS